MKSLKLMQVLMGFKCYQIIMYKFSTHKGLHTLTFDIFSQNQ